MFMEIVRMFVIVAMNLKRTKKSVLLPSAKLQVLRPEG